MARWHKDMGEETQEKQKMFSFYPARRKASPFRAGLYGALGKTICFFSSKVAPQ